MNDKKEQEKEQERRWGKRLTKGAYYSMNVLLPLSETKYAARKIGPSLLHNFQRIKHLSPQNRLNEKLKEPVLSFDGAVAASGLSIESLKRRFIRRKRVCLALAAIPSLLIISVLIVVILSGMYTPLLLIKSFALILVLLSLAALPFVQALVCSWRLWQLEERRASPDEQGGFKDFLALHPWYKTKIPSDS